MAGCASIVIQPQKVRMHHEKWTWWNHSHYCYLFVRIPYDNSFIKSANKRENLQNQLKINICNMHCTMYMCMENFEIFDRVRISYYWYWYKYIGHFTNIGHLWTIKRDSISALRVLNSAHKLTCSEENRSH